MEIIIDPKSGFCFGVQRAIELAETKVAENTVLYCLGEIVHNAAEVDRMKKKGIVFIDYKKFLTLSDCKVLIRAHGEPPETYRYASKNNIEIIDATCPVVLKLQEKVRNARIINPKVQIVIYGRKDHPEVIGLRGQVYDALIIESKKEVHTIDFTRPVALFAQTTKDREEYAAIKKEIMLRMRENGLPEKDFITYNSICGQVANRAPWLAEFSRTVDALVFVGGKNSSNSKVLFEVCRKNNPQSFFITSPEEIESVKLNTNGTIGITGATSTPSWLIEKVADTLQKAYATGQ
jgi:4-hydroxy-3-methylbut-2-enyl diphosphate reductase